MAKNRQVRHDSRATLLQPNESALPRTGDVRLFSQTTGQRIATTMASAALVYVAYWPHDSVEVQQGSARYLVLWLLVNAAIAFMSFGTANRRDLLIDILAWCLPAWMALSLFVHHETANLRLGVNEVGWWMAMAASVSVGRRVASRRDTAVTFLQLIVTLSFAVAVYGWHQWLVGIPNMIAAYEADPETMLRQIGITAEKGSALRVVFENRLYDGGPTGTFALANSMAVMLLGGLVIACACVHGAWQKSKTVHRCAGAVVIIIIGSMLLAARSRASVLAMIIVLGGYLFQKLIMALHSRRPQSRVLMVGLVATPIALVVGGVAIAVMFRNSEWLSQAPASLAIRMNYWKACFGMLGDSPWFGIGPGQFKASYESFRAAASNEQIADPHQFLLQIASAGGFPALAIFVCMLLGTMRSFLVRRDGIQDEITQPEQVAESIQPNKRSLGASVWLGTCLALAMVWLVGPVIGMPPTFDAGLLATVAALGLALYLCYGGMPTVFCEREPRVAAAYAVLAMAVALLASGGITVPGVCLVAWMLVGITAPFEGKGTHASTPASAVAKPRRWQSVGFASLAGLSAVLWCRLGIVPVDRANVLQNQFESRWSLGQVEPAIAALEQAAEVDPWNVQPWLQLASVDRTLAVAQPDQRAAWEQRWQVAEGEAIRRAACDPVVWKQLGDNRLIHFQRYGDRASLELARDLFSQAIMLSPSHEAYAAQQAAIMDALGDVRAREIAAKAEVLSRAGGYYERSLPFTLIYVPKHLGAEVTKNPRQRSAAELLADMIGKQK